MKLQILTGENFKPGFLKKIMEIDRLVYKDEYVGNLENMQVRYDRNQRSFVCVTDGERVAGYINFFPVTEALWDEITETGMTIRDDDIRPDELADYEKGDGAKNRLFIISVAVHPDYQNRKEVIIELTNGWIDYLNKLQKEGYPITAISGTAVSEDGMKFLSARMFCMTRQLTDGNRVYVCEGLRLEKLLKNELYFKSYRDDVYLFIPFAENPKNPKSEKLFVDKTNETDGISGPGWIEDTDYQSDDSTVPFDESDVRYLISEIDNCQRYECTNEAKDELERFYFGEFLLMHTHDDYPDEGEPEVLGEVKAYLSILAHQKSNMYVAMLVIPNCSCSTSQLEDQLFHDCLNLRCSEKTPKEIAENWGEQTDEKGHFKYFSLGEFLGTEYGLLPCGSGKVLTCMSKKPDEEQEFLNILSGETYYSLHQTFHIDGSAIKEMASEDKNRAIYDYYEAYMSEKVVAFVFRDKEDEAYFSDKTLWGNKKHFRDRSELTATYVFIIELVMLQNTALNKMTMKVSRALSLEGDVDYDYIDNLYRDYAHSVKFWNDDNFRYLGTQQEALQIRKAFDNDNLRRIYREQQEFLEQMIDLKSAQDERRSSKILGGLGALFALLQVRDFITEMFKSAYDFFGIDVGAAEAGHTFAILLLGGVFLYFIFQYVLTRKHRREQQEALRDNYRLIVDADKNLNSARTSKKEVGRRE